MTRPSRPDDRGSRPELGGVERRPVRFSTRADVPLVGDVDVERVLADLPAGYAMKGMFFSRYLDEAWASGAGELELPPPNGKYHAFESYPMRDYIRLFDRIARARFPGSTREAYRLLARGEIEVFTETTLGKVTFSMLKAPDGALVRYPDLFGVLARGPVVGAAQIQPRTVAVTFERFVGATEHIIGVLEGLVMAFDEVPALDVAIDEQRRATFTVRW